jgi:type IV pilus assembly protein PilY1
MTIANSLNNTLTNIGTSEPVRYLGAVIAKDLSYYLRAQSSDRLTVFKYSPTNNWTPLWTSYCGGSGQWNGSTFVNNASIKALPNNAPLCDNEVVLANSLMLPVTLPATGNACYGTAHYYPYKIQDGYFPSATFYNTDNSVISSTANSGVIDLGYGAAHTLQIADALGNNKLIGLGVATQTLNNGTGISKSIYIKDTFTTGIRSWRELR